MVVGLVGECVIVEGFSGLVCDVCWVGWWGSV